MDRYIEFEYGEGAMNDYALRGGWESLTQFIDETEAGIFDQWDLYWETDNSVMGVPNGQEAKVIVGHVLFGRLYRTECEGLKDPVSGKFYLPAENYEEYLC
jgi:hypothetical protein